MRKNYIFMSLLIAATWVHVIEVRGQQVPEISTKQPVYININQASAKDVFEVRDNLMSFQYQNTLGDNNELTLALYDWKSELKMTYVLDAESGLNQYSISLEDAGIDLEAGSLYRCVLKDQKLNELKWSVHAAIKPKDAKLTPAIIAKPIEVDCSKMRRESVIEFYSDVKGGNAPYTVNWFVINESGTKLLYQPREDVADANVSSMITVDKSLNYQVMLNVTDGCGNTAQKMVSVTCQNNKKKISTIFVEPLPVRNKTIVPIREVTP